jgi:uncharacterized membrane protein
MKHDESVNEEEWNNPENWTTPRFFSLYFSKKDSRLWVPKQVVKLGYTINLGHPKGGMVFLGFTCLAPLVPIVILIAMIGQHCS